MRLLFDACIFAVVSSVVVGFAPVRSGGRFVGRQTIAPRFVATSPFDWTDDDDDDDDDELDYDIESTPSVGLISSPGVVISCAMAVAAAAMAWLSNDIHIMVGTGATVLATGGAVAAVTVTAIRSASSTMHNNVDEELWIEAIIDDESSLEEDSSEQWSADNVRSFDSQDYAAPSESASDTSSNNLAQQWQQNQAVERLNTNTEFAPLEIDDSTALDNNEETVYDAAYDPPLTPATASALYSSASAAQLDAAPVPLTTKIERIKVELELAREWQEANMAIKPAPPLHNGYQPVADPLKELKPPSLKNGPLKFPDAPIISSPTFPMGGKTTASFTEIADKLKTELDLARDFFDVE